MVLRQAEPRVLRHVAAGGSAVPHAEYQLLACLHPVRVLHRRRVEMASRRLWNVSRARYAAGHAPGRATLVLVLVPVHVLGPSCLVTRSLTLSVLAAAPAVVVVAGE